MREGYAGRGKRQGLPPAGGFTIKLPLGLAWKWLVSVLPVIIATKIEPLPFGIYLQFAFVADIDLRRLRPSC